MIRIGFWSLILYCSLVLGLFGFLNFFVDCLLPSFPCSGNPGRSGEQRSTICSYLLLSSISFATKKKRQWELTNKWLFDNFTGQECAAVVQSREKCEKSLECETMSKGSLINTWKRGTFLRSSAVIKDNFISLCVRMIQNHKTFSLNCYI